MKLGIFVVIFATFFWFCSFAWEKVNESEVYELRARVATMDKQIEALNVDLQKAQSASQPASQPAE